MRFLVPALLLVVCGPTAVAARPPVYLWFEAEWFEGVKGKYAYWPGPFTGQPPGHWMIAGPGVSPEWTQGGESEGNSIAVPLGETNATCHRDFVVPRAGKYKVWVRYCDYRKRQAPFTVTVRQRDRPEVSSELGVRPVVPVNDEYQLYWGWSFGWGVLEGNLTAGAARLILTIDKPGQAWRQVDTVLITDDLDYTPVAREKPPFGYRASFALQPTDGASWRGSAKEPRVGASWKRTPLGGQDFSLWTDVEAAPQQWEAQPVERLTLQDLFFQFAPPGDIRERFHKQFAGQPNVPILSWPRLRPGFGQGGLAAEKPLLRWLERTGTPFYAVANDDKKATAATHEALAGPLADQFLGYLQRHFAERLPDKPLAPTRRQHLDAWGKELIRNQPEPQRAKTIPCPSVNSTALTHELFEFGSKVVGYEAEATHVHVPMRIAFARGAARQYGGQWLNQASARFGDSGNSFVLKPQPPRGAGTALRGKVSETDGVSASWYRKLLYLNYLGGASAVCFEHGLNDQWILLGPGIHNIFLSPLGRASEDFIAFVDRLPDRGEPYTPVALLLSYGHGYDRVNDACKMLNCFAEDRNDLELRELFNVCWHPSGVVEGRPAASDVQSLPSGVYGNLFDVLVDRPGRAKAVLDYPVVWAAGDVKWEGPWPGVLEEFLNRGGTLVVNVEAARQLPARLLGVQPAGKKVVAEQWAPAGGQRRATTPFEVEVVELRGAKVLVEASPKVPLVTRHAVGAGAVIVTLCPHMIGQDERAHPALPYLMNGLTAGLLPVEVRLANGAKPGGEVMYQVNRTKDGYLVALFNNGGVDKTQNGVARVDRRAFVDVVLRTALPVRDAKEYTEPRGLTAEKGKDGTEVRLRVHPGDVQVVYLKTH